MNTKAETLAALTTTANLYTIIVIRESILESINTQQNQCLSLSLERKNNLVIRRPIKVRINIENNDGRNHSYILVSSINA